MNDNKLTAALRTSAEQMYSLRDTYGHTPEMYKRLDHVALCIEVLAHIVNGKTVEKAFGAPGDWGYGTPIGDGLLAFLREPRPAPGSLVKPDGVLPIETIVWHFVPDLPDDEVRCLLAIDSKHTDELSIGYHEAGWWCFDDGTHVEGAAPVYAWAHMPAKPTKQGGAS